jgi:hypothetical protein
MFADVAFNLSDHLSNRNDVIIAITNLYTHLFSCVFHDTVIVI